MPPAGDVEEQKGEQKPLLADEAKAKEGKKERGRSSWLQDRAMSHLGHFRDSAAAAGMFDDEEERVMEYETYHLGTWKTFVYVTGTVWKNALLWLMVLRLLLVSLAVGVLIFLLSADPRSIDTSKFAQISNLLKVFVGFLLGFFLASSVGRWGNAVGGFLSLCNAIKTLIMLLHSLGVPNERIDKIKQYCMLSAEFLVAEMRLRTNTELKEQETRQMLEDFVAKGELDEGDVSVLMEVKDHATLMWVWVVSLISRAAQDQEVPHMGSPTYGRLVMLANSAEEGIRQVIIASKVQLPFVYVHTLALLVHTNNLLCAVGFGCTLGTSIAAILARFGIHLYGRQILETAGGKAKGSIMEDLQGIGMAFVASFVVPLMYQAFLQIGLLLAQPFDNPSSSISAVPAHRMLNEMRRELADQEKMASRTSWPKPCFQDAPPPNAPIVKGLAAKNAAAAK